MRDEFASALALVEKLPGRVVFGPGRLDHLDEWAQVEGAHRVLLVTDPGIVSAGHADRALISLVFNDLQVFMFDGAGENPTTDHVAAGLAFARAHDIDFLVSVGGGSAMDCAKGINLLMTNGGEIQNYWGIDKAVKPLLPMIAVPTTAGTGSEAQSFALISDAVTHRKMACGDRRLPKEGGLRPRVSILDPNLTVTAPRRVTAAAGIDAIAHAVETAASRVRTPFSQELSRAAWQLLSSSFVRVLSDPNDENARSRMLVGAHLAGAAIEYSMLGAAHACANPLTARFQVVHGLAVGLMLPHVVRFNSRMGSSPYAELMAGAEDLAQALEGFGRAAQLPKNLADCGVPEDSLPELAALAAQEWTATFNPLPVLAADFLELYRSAFH